MDYFFDETFPAYKGGYEQYPEGSKISRILKIILLSIKENHKEAFEKNAYNYQIYPNESYGYVDPNNMNNNYYV